ncbi:CfaE/CblD family pilus tip adhesin [Burkholderia sp. AU45388]|uniref:CfaE/CblD family pilus tip adhesin n=1 Tax=Burkholderia sp. AU45388 TaxID=3059206 RepID=UPI00264CEDDE|nr:CfaE/CblD family pilus tip adhesin [Burkholderia sp. AU45388]MDN7429216.1 CfaE/CblD family pilus tip adhesin [Burkholderia sp. AU45388]
MNFLHVFLLIQLLSVVLMLAPQAASAQEVIPLNWHDRIEKSFDLDSPPTIQIWNERIVGSSEPHRTSYFVCKSDSDPQFGACATKPEWAASGSTSVELLFIETRSNAQQKLVVQGNRRAAGRRYKLHTGIFGGGNLSASLWVDASELRKLPFGGIWNATLKFNQGNWRRSDTLVVAEPTVEFTLHVTDTKNVQIYLPDHSTTTPTVDLGLSQPNGRDSRTTGRRSIDMCLYDGFGSNSSWFDVTLKDDLGALRRKPGSFSVVRHGTSGEFHDRIDYGVSYLHEGQQKALNNGETIRLSGGSGTGLRSVHLPNILVAVMCKPMPLTLETPEFNAKDKRAGSYSGKLRIISRRRRKACSHCCGPHRDCR